MIPHTCIWAVVARFIELKERKNKRPEIGRCVRVGMGIVRRVNGDRYNTFYCIHV